MRTAFGASSVIRRKPHIGDGFTKSHLAAREIAAGASACVQLARTARILFSAQNAAPGLSEVSVII